MELEPLKGRDNETHPNVECPQQSLQKETHTNEENKPINDGTRWNSRVEFLLAIVGYTVGIGSVYRFPILCARNGGGAFLIPFLFFMITCGGPLYYIEVCLGQFSGKSAGFAFEFCPLFKGIGLMMCVFSFNVLLYYTSVMGWILYYLYSSFFPTLPWETCGNPWNTDSCRALFSPNFGNVSSVNGTVYTTTVTNKTIVISSTREFWANNVLNRSAGFENMGSIQWHLMICNGIAWLISYAALIKGVKSLGKVVYVTATAPYLLLTILLIRGLTLDGAVDGVMWYLTPDFSKLWSTQVWVDAAIQVFYSLGPVWGGVISMSSYNHFKQNSITETVIVVVSDFFTAFYAGLVVFSCIGFMAKESGISVEEAAKSSGPGLVFIAYPEAISRMPLPHLWAVFFFVTLTFVGFDTSFGMMETLVGAILDAFPSKLRNRRLVVLSGLTLTWFLLSTPLAMRGGIYVWQICDWYMTAFCFMLAAALEVIMVAWIYGADRFASDISLMTGRSVSVLLRLCWCILMPVVFIAAFLIQVFTYSIPDYGDGYVYPPYSIIIGLVISVIPLVPVLVYMVIGIYQTPGSLIKRLATLLRPSVAWQPQDKQAHKIYNNNKYGYENSALKRVKMDLFGDKNTPWI